MAQSIASSIASAKRRTLTADEAEVVLHALVAFEMHLRGCAALDPDFARRLKALPALKEHFARLSLAP